MWVMWGCGDTVTERYGDVAQPSLSFFPALPDHSTNPLTEAGVALGERLFFDPILSADSTVSCASCHQPERAFATADALAIGIGGRLNQRNAPSLLNVAYKHQGLFWDGRTETLEAQALIPVEAEDEMGHDWAALERVLNEHAVYPDLFSAAFPETGGRITRTEVARALAQYQRTLLQAGSKYDLVELGKDTFTAAEARGFAIFFDTSSELPHGECGHCHTPPLFSDLTFMNNGLDGVTDLAEYEDKGRGGVTGQYYDNGRFRVPSLRNVAITAPYMHDGRMPDLHSVIDHYDSGGQYAENVDPKVRKLHLSDRDKLDLIAFLRTLTDSVYVK